MDRTVIFSKMSGHGNDFIVIDNRDIDRKIDWSRQASVWCKRRVSIGADGLLLIEPSAVADFRMRIFNADGSEAEMCGNGARCAAAFAVRKGIAQPKMVMETMAGPVGASVDGEMVAIQLTNPSFLRDVGFVELDGGKVHCYFLNTGVPHTIVFMDALSDVPADEIEKVGCELRFHDVFSPEGTNVDFVQVIRPGYIKTRTYERGVEEETLACGTGAVASAILSSVFRDAGDSPIDVEMPGGTLTVDFAIGEDSFGDVWLKGNVAFVYEGNVSL